MEALGRLVDVVAGVAPQAAANAITGNRVHLKNAAGVTIVVFCGAGTAGEDLDIDLQQHTAASSGTSADLDIIDHYYLKTETTLDGDETWTEVTQAAASEITDAGGAGTSAEEQNILVVEVDATQLSDGYEWVSVNIPDLGAAGDKVVSVLYLLRDLVVQRDPTALVNPQA